MGQYIKRIAPLPHGSFGFYLDVWVRKVSEYVSKFSQGGTLAMRNQTGIWFRFKDTESRVCFILGRKKGTIWWNFSRLPTLLNNQKLFFPIFLRFISCDRNFKNSTRKHIHMFERYKILNLPQIIK